jgi:hypothetical protein
MPDEEKRREYVLNDVGKIYIGSHSKPKGRQWIYGQVGSLLPIKTPFIQFINSQKLFKFKFGLV